MYSVFFSLIHCFLPLKMIVSSKYNDYERLNYSKLKLRAQESPWICDWLHIITCMTSSVPSCSQLKMRNITEGAS